MNLSMPNKSIILLTLIAVLILVFPIALWIHDASFRGYIQTDFKELSDKPVLGIDVSHYQGVIDWKRVGRSGLDFVYIKATGGETYVDPDFAKNWHGARVANLTRGAYHFFLASDDAAKQAENFLKALGELRDSDLPPMLDVEITDGQAHAVVEQRALQWLQLVEKALGRKPIVYSDSYFGKTVLTDPAFSNYSFWVADYGEHIEAIPAPWKTTGWTFWQHSPHGVVSGIHGPVDMDRFHSNFRALQDFIRQSKVKTASQLITDDEIPRRDTSNNQQQGSVE